MKLGSTLGFSAGQGLLAFNKPSGFNWNYTSEFSITRRARTYFTDFMPSSSLSAPSGTTYYVNPAATGTADGLSWTNAFTNIQDALKASNAAVILLAPGHYDWRACGWISAGTGLLPAFARDTAMICVGGKAILSTNDPATQSWSQNGTYPVVSETTHNAIFDVVDLTYKNARGIPIPYVKRASVADVAANPGSWYFTGTTLSVHTHNSRAADSSVMAFRQKDNMDIRGSYNFYFENIEFWGGSEPIVYNVSNGNNKHIVCKNCAALYGPNGGFLFRDISRVSMLDCHAEYSELDGFAYRQNVHSVQTHVLEVNCTAYNNGIYDYTNNYDNNVNGSSAHDGVRIVRLNGFHAGNDGGQIVDTGGAQSLNLGVQAGESLATTQSGTDDVGFKATASGEMWLENCSAFGSHYNRVNGSSTITDLGGFSGNGPGGDSGTIT